MTKKKIKQPDPQIHFMLSCYKSILRIIAGGLLFCGFPSFFDSIAIAGLLFVAAEIIGIGEELF